MKKIKLFVLFAFVAISYIHAQNVGISDNIFIPRSYLHVHQPLLSGNLLQLTNLTSGNATNAVGLVFSVDGANYTMRNFQAGNLNFQTGLANLRFFTDNAERMTIISSGNVGIGTITPSERFHVDGSVRLQNLPIGTTETNALLIDAAGVVRARTLSPVAFTGVVTETDPSAWRLTGNTALASDFIGTTNAEDFRMFTNNAERIRLTSGGNVGIGDLSPLALLTVGSGDLFRVENTGHTRTINASSALPAYSFAASISTGMWSPGIGTLAFSTAGFERMRMTIGGNVGIGTITPSTRFHVNGTVRFEGLPAGTTETSALFIDGLGAVRTRTLHSVAFTGAVTEIDPTAWLLTGNVGTVDGTNFIGTTDGVPFNIRVNNQNAGRIDHILVNTFFGYWAGNANTAGSWNTASGMYALFSNTIGSSNTANGVQSLQYNTIGFSNTAIGVGALFYNSAGNDNVALGAHAGLGATGIDFNQCTFIGAFSYPDVARTNVTMLGFGITNAQNTDDNQVLLGNTGITSIRAQVNSITAYSDARFKFNVKNDIKGLDFIMRLKPVTYNQDPTILHHKWGTSDSLLNKIDHSQIKSQRFIGFLAQDVEKAAKESGFDFPGIDAPKNEKEVYTMRYVDFIMPMVKAMQEQQKMIEELKIANYELQITNEELKTANIKFQTSNSSMQSAIEEIRTENNELKTQILTINNQLSKLNSVLGTKVEK